MNKIIAVVVTYNRLEKLKINIECLLQQTYKLHEIIVVENACTDETASWLDEMASSNPIIHPIHLSENTGGAGGFSTGMQKAAQENADFIWGMDDDAYPEPDALDQLVSAYNETNKVVCLWSNCQGIISNERIELVKKWMFVGFFVPKEIYALVGFPRADFFIFHDDGEYGDRIQKAGYQIYRVNNSIIRHQDAVTDLYPEKVWGFYHCVWSKLPDWKLYYLVRNFLLRYKWTDFRKYKVLFVDLPIVLFKTWIFHTKQSKIFFKGLRDGLIGKSGKLQ